MFRGLRNEDAFAGKCGVCEYRKVCGGSRARARAPEGAQLGSVPPCVLVAPRYAGEAKYRTHHGKRDPWEILAECSREPLRLPWSRSGHMTPEGAPSGFRYTYRGGAFKS